MRRFALLIAGFTLLAASSGCNKSGTTGLQYPQTRRVAQVDTMFGTVVADPYRWLENDVREDTAVANWVEEENKVTFGYLNAIPERDRIHALLEKVWNYERESPLLKRGGRYFYDHNDGLQNQSVVYYKDSLAGPAHLLFDPNTWSTDGTVALGEFEVSHDGRYVAYGVQDGGTDWRTWHVRDMRTGKDLPDKLEWVKFNTPEWTPDDAGIYYCRYPAPKEGETFQQSNYNMTFYLHKLGTNQSQDKQVYARPDAPDLGFQLGRPETGDQYLTLQIWHAGHDNLLSYMDLKNPSKGFMPVVTEWGAEYNYLGCDGPVAYFRTDKDAPNNRVIAIDLHKPDSANWRDIVPEGDDAMENAELAGNYIVVNYLHDVASRLSVYSLDGKLIRDIKLPGLGTVSGLHGTRANNELFFQFSSFATPLQNHRVDVETGEDNVYWQSKVAIDVSQFAVTQVFYPSKDGTRIPMFLTYRKGMKRDGSNPTILYGYGGFNSPSKPYYSSTRLTWCNMGGIYAVANIRGGSEYGKAWHEAGMKLNKQNVFDDFIAAAEWLINNKYTSAPKLAINGGSNGGLLVGACETQRPDLFGACVPQVGVMDMLRFNKFTAGRFWTDDFGSPEVEDQFKALYAYSPYHNIKDGTKYPPTLITTADTDDRVVPGHSFKYAAAMQHAQAGDAPILIRIETRAGHGAGTPTMKSIDLYSDIYAFLVKNLGITLPPGF